MLVNYLQIQGFCSNFTSVSIGNSVTSIGTRVFLQCSNLETVYCYASTPPSVDKTSFDDRPAKILHVPVETKDLYASRAVWQDFGTIIDDLAPNAAGVEGITMDSDAPKAYYRLDGMKVSADALTPGIYIIRQGNTSKQVLIQ